MKYNPSIVSEYFVSCGLPEPVFEHRFHPVRKWRFDVAWLDHKLAVEVQGGVWTGGRHSRGAAMLKEWEKLNTAASMGWRVMFCQPRDICTNVMVEYIKEALS